MEFIVIVALGITCLSLLGIVMVLIRQKNQQKLQVLSARAEIQNLEQALVYEKRSVTEKAALVDNLKSQLEESFQNIAHKALSQNHEAIMGIAKNSFQNSQNNQKDDLHHRQKAIESLVEPIAKALTQVDHKLNALEKERATAYVDLKTQIEHLALTHKDLKLETQNLVKALRAPQTRGQWGEMQLKRVVEMAGMVNHCDFHEQVSVNDNRLRPDMLIKLPGDKNIVVDAKTTLSAYLNALEAKDEVQREQFLVQHAQQIRTHVQKLSQKNYWDQFENSPEFVVMFLPNEALFSAALEKDPTLIEYGVSEKVILATPTTLIALLKAVSYGWRQQSIADDAKTIQELGRELYKRIQDMGGHFAKMGRSLNQSVDAYNQTLGSLERRVLVSARKMSEMPGFSGTNKIPDNNPIDEHTRPIQALELLNKPLENEKEAQNKESQNVA